MSVKIFVSFCLEPIKLIELGGTPLKVTIFFSTAHLYREILRRIFGTNFKILIIFPMQNVISNCYIVLMYKSKDAI